VERSQTGGNTAPDPWKGWSDQAHIDAPGGGGGMGRFRTAGSHGTGNAMGSWRGVPHPLAPAARYLSVSEPYAELGGYPYVQVEEDRGTYFISLPTCAAMRPAFRTTSQKFQTTVKQMAAKGRLAVAVSGNRYSPAALDSLAKDRDGFWHISWVEGPLGGYTFGQGEPPGDTTQAIGGLGPMISGGIRFGSKNEYRRGAPPGGPETGDPGPAFRGYLETRHNEVYRSFAKLAGRGMGKIVIGYGGSELPVKIVVQRHGVEGLSLDEIRDRLHRDNVQHAVFMDGRDCAMLFANGRFYVQQGTLKDSTNAIGVGFQVPFSYLAPGGRAMGSIA
jgi:hypothetical protein